VDSSRRAQPVSARKVDVPVLVVSTLTVFFAILFATLLLLRSRSSPLVAHEPATSLRTVSPVSAPPPREPVVTHEPEPRPARALRAELERLGIQCSEGANCDPE